MKKKFWLIYFFLIVATLLSLAVAVTIGSTNMSIADVYRVIALKLFGTNTDLTPAKIDIVWLIRLPRLVLALGVGMALSVSGLTMQAIVRNPMADPYIMGISAGAYLGASIAMLGGIGSHWVGLLAFVGAFAASLLVVAISSIGSPANPMKLILAGSAISAGCSAFSNFLIYQTNKLGSVQAIVNWTMGTLGRATWKMNIVVLFVAVLGTIFLSSQYRALNLMLLGDETASTLGISLQIRRVVYLLLVALMVGISVYAAGMIGFIGLIIPHIVRLLIGPDHKQLIPICALIGGIFLIWADVLCRTMITGTELPIGIFTSMLGTPILIYLMISRKYGFKER